MLEKIRRKPIENHKEPLTIWQFGKTLSFSNSDFILCQRGTIYFQLQTFVFDYRNNKIRLNLSVPIYPFLPILTVISSGQISKCLSHWLSRPRQNPSTFFSEGTVFIWQKTFISSLSHPNMYNSESLKKSESGLNVRLNLPEYSRRLVRIEHFDSGKPTQG